MRKKLISLLLCLAMVFSLGVGAFAEESGSDTVTGEYSYCPALGFLDFVSNQTYTFTYSDDYFKSSGYDYNHALAIMSMNLTQSCFASAASSTEGWDTANSNFNLLMEKCGFTNIDCNDDAVSHPGGETIGAYAATKQISDGGEEYTLIVVGIRGHNYGGEWYSNFDVGVSGDHAGFADARDKVLSFMKDYIAEYSITGPVKFWITGYSRGAITANMVGGALDQGYVLSEDISFKTRDLYCYTFETPQGVDNEHAHDDIYCNIHNILNHNDFVPLVSFSAWGQTRYGVDYYLPCRQYDEQYYQWKEDVDAKLQDMGWMDIMGLTLDTIDDFNYISLNPLTTIAKKDVTQIEYYPEAISALLETMAPTRQYYIDNLQSDIQELSKTLLGVDTNLLLKALVLFGEKFCSLDNAKELLSSLTITGAIANGTAVDVVVDLFMEAMQEAGCAGYDGDQVRAMLKNLVPKVLVFAAKNPDTALTLMGNLIQIVNAHFPEIGLAWMLTAPAEYFEAQGKEIDEEHLYSECGGNSACCPSAAYKDVPAYGTWSHNAIDFCISRGIMGSTSTSEITFEPSTSCTRAMAVAILYRISGDDAPEYSRVFKDVANGKWYTDAVIWAEKAGIVSGYSDGSFGPDDKVTREQLVEMLMNYAENVLGADTSDRAKISGFADFASVTWSRDAMQWAIAEGIISGAEINGVKYLLPQDNAARDQVAQIFMNFIKNIVEA